MIRSMTGYGIHQKLTPLGAITVEAKSINHRYLDISLRVPKKLLPLENRIKEMVKAHFSRGRFDISVELNAREKDQFKLEPNIETAQMYVHALETLKATLNLKGEVTLDLVSRAKDIITVREEEENIDFLWEEVSGVLLSCLEALEAMRKKEGDNLAIDLEQRLKRVAHHMDEIKSRSPSILESYRTRISERVSEMTGGLEVDPWRLNQEIAYLAERSDITEETVRVESHLRQVGQMVELDEPLGRKMDFLLQEIHREVNTISAKANDAIISQRVVEIKAELERMREQVQNIE